MHMLYSLYHFSILLSLSLSLSQAFLRSFSMEMEAEDDDQSQPNRLRQKAYGENPRSARCHLDGVHKTNITEGNKKRKLQTDQLDLPRSKHKCWVGRFSSEHGSMSDDNLELGSTHMPMFMSETYASALDISETKSSKGSNNFSEDSDAAMSVNDEPKHQMDCPKPYLYGRPSYSFINWDGYYFKKSCREEDTVVERESSYDYDDDIQALVNLEEHSLGLGICRDHDYSDYVKKGNEHSREKEFEDVFAAHGANPSIYILSSGKWDVNQEAESSTRPPTIDQEFEQYFSMLML
ncbi:protein FAR-RED ELONGATED HYPOCOTYL 1-like [Prosopis cineraria]|uniref:protein FAR-RED ELONGATED HYPOCOTYL 1-like n=1 Tax=Prosopis cineraria TaxID=364024 RepID=UPI00240F0B35|nr:protein FAR-RED ELONGATED HYPOCOTYL 1-like [Prosopis cineraria]